MVKLMTSDAGLTKVPRIKRNRHYDQEWRFDEGDVRKALERVFSQDAEYILFQTAANKDAAEALKEYVAFREGMETPWNIRKIEEGDKPAYVPGARDECNGLQFDNSLMDRYLRGINKIASETLGEENFSDYSIVSTRGVHNLERDPNAVFWPRTFIVNTENEDDLKGIIDNLSGDKSFEVLRELESPQFYQMAEIETLHNLGIPPLNRLARELRVGAGDLATYIDFFAQMTESYKWTGPVIDVDSW